jgi:hypothetical protein
LNLALFLFGDFHFFSYHTLLACFKCLADESPGLTPLNAVSLPLLGIQWLSRNIQVSAYTDRIHMSRFELIK